MNRQTSRAVSRAAEMLLFATLITLACATTNAEDHRPNILLAIADDWGWPHAGAYGDPVVKTPTFDRLAREGVLFRHVFVSSPSCTASRGAILTGQFPPRLEAAANLWSVFPDKFTTYPEWLQQAGYEVGVCSKGWGPGKTETPGRELAGERFRNFQAFLAERDRSQPFCFWLGSGDPHRDYEPGSGAASGMDISRIQLPACFPDDPTVRGDVADYYFEVQRFDALVAAALADLDGCGELQNTIVVMTGDHGMPFPRCKSNLYDTGTRVPLAIRWPDGGVGASRQVDDFVSLTDLAPTFLEFAGLQLPASITGRSLCDVLRSDRSGQIDPTRNAVLLCKERHVPAQEAPDMGGYPSRGLRTREYLYIRNFRPDRWPNGTPNYERAAVPGNWYADTDNGPSKTYLIEHRNQDAAHRRLFDLAFAKRPSEELYDLSQDPHQLRNVAGQSAYVRIRQTLAARLDTELRVSGDPRVLGGVDFDDFPYLGGGPKHPAWKSSDRESGS